MNVIIHPGYVKKFDNGPDVYIDANKDERLPPDGFVLNHSRITSYNVC